jgi:hypothetical protein
MHFSNWPKHDEFTSFLGRSFTCTRGPRHNQCKEAHKVSWRHGVHLDLLDAELTDQLRGEQVLDGVLLLRFALNEDQGKSSR